MTEKQSESIYVQPRLYIRGPNFTVDAELTARDAYRLLRLAPYLGRNVEAEKQKARDAAMPAQVEEK